MMKRKYKKQIRIAMAAVLASTSVVYSIDTIFAQDESMISQYSSHDDAKARASDIEINEANFPDEKFRAYISANFDSDQNGILSSRECNRVTNISLDNQEIKSVVGIEHFPYLWSLDCNHTKITELDVSKNTELEYLSCQGALLTGLDVSTNTLLRTLDVTDNELAWLYIGRNHPNLKTLNKNGSAINLGIIGKILDMQEVFPGIDPNRVTIVSGATLDKNTGILSDYVDGTPIIYQYDCGSFWFGTEVLDVTLDFNVLIDSDRYTPQVQEITVNKGDTPNAEDGIANKNDLPATTVYEWKNVPDTDNVGTVIGTIVVTYPDTTSEEVNITIKVKERDADIYIPQGQDIAIDKGDIPNAEDGIANKKDLPTTTVYAWKDIPDTNTVGIVTGTIVVTYPDGTSEEVEVIIHVIGKDVDNYTPQGQDIVIDKGATPNAEDGIANKKDLPTTTIYAWKNIPDTNTVGIVTGTIVVTYPDGTSEEVEVIIHVIGKDVDNYTPQGQDIVIDKGATPNAEDGIANKKDLPAATVYAWKNIPDTSTEGIVTGTIVVTYPDGTSEEVEVTIHVIEKDANKYTPIVDQNKVVNKGDKLNVEDFIMNKDMLPRGTQFQWQNELDTSVEGMITGAIIVTYPDGSTTTIDVKVTVASQEEVIPGNSSIKDESGTNISGSPIAGVQTGDYTKVGLWTLLVGLSTGLMAFFTKKKFKDEL